LALSNNRATQLGFHEISKQETQYNRVNKFMFNIFELMLMFMFMFNVLELGIFKVLEVGE